MKRIIIASKNPVKIKAVQLGFEKMFPWESFQCEGISIDSWVADQPMTNAETFIWATNRVTSAQKLHSNADYWVWIEGGIEKTWSDMEVFGWIVVLWKNTLGKARTSTFFLPEKVIQLIDEWKELDEASDIVFSKINSKQKAEAIWILTGDIITRTAYYVEPVILALIPFKNSEIY